jgi:hypothetical protein
MELREKVADAIIEAGNRHFSDPHELNHRPAVLAVADAILSLPELKEALAYMEAVDSAHPVFGEIREMLNRQAE